MTSNLQTDSLVRVVSETPQGHQHYFGFHDVSPWSPDDQTMVLLRVPKDLKSTPQATDTAEVCLWNPGHNEPSPIGTTHAFNWQQGARAQWVTSAAGPRVMVNDLEDGRPVTRFYDAESASWSKGIPAVYSVHPSGAFGLAPDWYRLARWWRDYSYDLRPSGRQSCGEPGDLRRVDLATGQESVIVPIGAARRLCGQGANAKGSDFISHVMFSPQGTRFCFMYRRFSEDHALFSFFLVCNSDGSDLRVLAKEKCSHFDWLDEDRVVIWTRKLPTQAAALRAGGWTKRFPFKQMVKLLRTFHPKLKQSLFAESYYQVDYREPGKMAPVGAGVLEQDGHPMFTPDRKWMVTDTYVFEGHQPLILFDMAAGQRHDVVRFPAHVDFLDPALKCDLHPRLDRSGRRVAVDSAHSGGRQLCVVDIGDFLDQAATS
jgi:hypothetical protein